MTGKPKGAQDGPPRWTYVAGAVVAVGGLGWGIVSYFIPKPEAAKPAAAPAVVVSGSRSVGVGTMSGGRISVGGSDPAQEAAASAPAKTADPH
jgi:hypothetical protein